MPWVPDDVHVNRTAAMRQAGKEVGPIAFAVRDELWKLAKVQAKGGEVEVTYEELAFVLCCSEEEAIKGIKALLSASVLTCPEQSACVATLAFPKSEWRRLNDTARKAERRAELREVEAA